MKHKVKLVKVHEESMDISVDGVLHRYLFQRPQPLGPADAAMLRNAFDARLIEGMYDLVRPSRGLRRWLSYLRRSRFKSSTLSGSVADFIERVGVEVNIDKKTKGVVLLESDVDKIRRGGEL